MLANYRSGLWKSRNEIEIALYWLFGGIHTSVTSVQHYTPFNGTRSILDDRLCTALNSIFVGVLPIVQCNFQISATPIIISSIKIPIFLKKFWFPVSFSQIITSFPSGGLNSKDGNTRFSD